MNWLIAVTLLSNAAWEAASIERQYGYESLLWWRGIFFNKLAVPSLEANFIIRTLIG
jgi:hypothetical protein